MTALEPRLRTLEARVPRKGGKGPLTLFDLELVADGLADIEEYTDTEWVDRIEAVIEGEEREESGRPAREAKPGGS